MKCESPGQAQRLAHSRPSERGRFLLASQAEDPEGKEPSVKQELPVGRGWILSQYWTHQETKPHRDHLAQTPQRHSRESSRAPGHTAWLQQARIHLRPPSPLTSCALFSARFLLLGLFWRVTGKKETERNPVFSHPSSEAVPGQPAGQGEGYTSLMASRVGARRMSRMLMTFSWRKRSKIWISRSVRWQ